MSKISENVVKFIRDFWEFFQKDNFMFLGILCFFVLRYSYDSKTSEENQSDICSKKRKYKQYASLGLLVVGSSSVILGLGRFCLRKLDNSKTVS